MTEKGVAVFKRLMGFSLYDSSHPVSQATDVGFVPITKYDYFNYIFGDKANDHCMGP